MSSQIIHVNDKLLPVEQMLGGEPTRAYHRPIESMLSQGYHVRKFEDQLFTQPVYHGDGNLQVE